MSDAIKSQGFKFEIGNGNSPLTYTEVKEVTSFSGPDGQANPIETTHLQSTAKEYLMGLQDNGSASIEVNHITDDPGQVAMRAAKASGDIQDFKATFSDLSTLTFQGFVMSNPLSLGVDNKVDGSFSILISGDAVLA